MLYHLLAHIAAKTGRRSSRSSVTDVTEERLEQLLTLARLMSKGLVNSKLRCPLGDCRWRDWQSFDEHLLRNHLRLFHPCA